MRSSYVATVDIKPTIHYLGSRCLTITIANPIDFRFSDINPSNKVKFTIDFFIFTPHSMVARGNLGT